MYNISGKLFESQYKDFLSGFRQWDQLEHADKYILHIDNIGSKLSIDEVSVSKGELYTVITNKAFKGKKGSLVAMLEGTKASKIELILNKIDKKTREKVQEVTLDMANSMEHIVTKAFPSSIKVTDRFHVQQLVSNAVQEIRIDIRKEVIKQENDSIREARSKKQKYIPFIYENGDTKKQLLARSRYLLFKTQGDWTITQKTRAAILFKEYPEIENAYELSMMFRSVYAFNDNIKDAKKSLDDWYRKIEEKDIDSFISAMDTIQVHEETILNYFINRSTNASAESFNAKLKGFRALVRGVRDKKFHLFRISKLYA